MEENKKILPVKKIGKNARIVKYSNELNLNRLSKLGPKEQDVFMSILRVFSNTNALSITIPIDKLRIENDMTGQDHKKLIEQVFRINDSLLSKLVFTIPSPDEESGNEFYSNTLFSGGIRVNAKEKTITVGLDPHFQNVLREIQGSFTQLNFLEFKKFRSKYTKALYRLFRKNFKGSFHITIKDFREAMGLNPDYPARLLPGIIRRAVNELQAYLYDKISWKTEVSPSRGHATIGFFFEFTLSKEKAAELAGQGKLFNIEPDMIIETAPESGMVLPQPVQQTAQQNVAKHGGKTEVQAFDPSQGQEATYQDTVPFSVEAASVWQKEKQLQPSGKIFPTRYYWKTALDQKVAVGADGLPKIVAVESKKKVSMKCPLCGADLGAFRKPDGNWYTVCRNNAQKGSIRWVDGIGNGKCRYYAEINPPTPDELTPPVEEHEKTEKKAALHEAAPQKNAKTAPDSSESAAMNVSIPQWIAPAPKTRHMIYHEKISDYTLEEVRENVITAIEELETDYNLTVLTTPDEVIRGELGADTYFDFDRQTLPPSHPDWPSTEEEIDEATADAERYEKECNEHTIDADMYDLPRVPGLDDEEGDNCIPNRRVVNAVPNEKLRMPPHIKRQRRR